jgi:hypothetical protein
MSRPQPAFRFDSHDRLSTQLPDGPVPCGRCEMCCKFFDEDIYSLRGVILCGDCRFFVRNGRWPNYEHSVGFNGSTGDIAVEASESLYHGWRGESGD